MTAQGGWERPAPPRTRERLLEAERVRDYESAALLCVAYCDHLARNSEIERELTMGQAQVYATLHLAAVTASAAAEAAENMRPQGSDEPPPQPNW